MRIAINFLEVSTPKFSERFWTWVIITLFSFFTIASFFAGQSLVLYILLLSLATLVIIEYPKVGLYALIPLTMWFERFFTLQPLIIGERIIKLYPLDMFLILIGVSLFLHFCMGNLQWTWHKLDTAILFFGGAVTLSYIIALSQQIDPELAFGTYKNYFLYAILYVYTALLLKTKKDWKECMQWFMIGGFGILFFVLYGVVVGQGLWAEHTPLSTAGTRLIAGSHAFFLTIFAFFILAKQLWPTVVEKKQEAMILAGNILCVVGIVLSLVRHIWAALGVLLIVWLIILPKEKKHLIGKIGLRFTVAASVLGLIFVWGSALITAEVPSSVTHMGYVLKDRLNIGNVVTLQDSSFQWRVAAWRAGLEAFVASPIFGTGLGKEIQGEIDIYIFTVAVRELHNNYFAILVQMGVVGIATLVYWFWIIFKSIWYRWRQTHLLDNFRKQLLFTWGSVLLYFIITFSISVYWDVNFFIIWWWIALAALRYLSPHTTY